MFLPEKIYASLVSRLVLTAAIKFHIEIQPPLIILYEIWFGSYLIIVTDAIDAVSVNFSGRCKFLLI